MRLAQIDFNILNQSIRSTNPNYKFGNLTKLGDIISALIPYLFTISGLLLLLYLLYGGYHLMLSKGDPKAVQEAQGKITNALIGFMIIFVAYWIVQIFGTILGIESIKNTFWFNIPPVID